MSILEDLFNGDLNPCEDCNPHEHPQYREVNKEVNQYMKQFEQKLSTPDYIDLENLLTAAYTSGGISNAHFFAHGFKIATLIAVETFSK